MIRNCLLSAACSNIHQQREKSLNDLTNQYRNNPEFCTNELFNLLCSYDKNDHILSYSFLKKLIKESKNERFIDLSSKFAKLYTFWYQENVNTLNIQKVYNFQKQNVIQLNALFLSLNKSNKYRQELIDMIPFKICQYFTKENSLELFLYLQYYSDVLKKLNQYRIGNINSKKAAMGSVMLFKVTQKLTPLNSIQASIWLDFIINFSNFNNWTPSKKYLLMVLIKYDINKKSLITLLDYLSSNFKIIWTLQDQCIILQGLNNKMTQIQNNINDYECKQVEKLLKCLKTFLHNFFVSEKQVQNTGDAMIVDYIYSFEQFQKISNFIINMIDYFSFNNEKQSMGNLSQLIVEYSTQILRLFSGYLDQQKIEAYSKKFMQRLGNDVKYQKIFVFLSSLPKFILQMFDYQKVITSILNGSIQLSEKYQPIYINFLNQYIVVNQYLDDSIVQKLANFFYNLIQARQIQVQNAQKMSKYADEKTQLEVKAQRICLSIHGLSKLGKFKSFVSMNPSYFQLITNKIFEYLLRSSNEFSILIESIGQLIKQNNQSWNQKISVKAMSHITTLLQKGLKEENTLYYQTEIQLYRIIKQTVSLETSFNQILNLMLIQNSYYKYNVNQWIQLKLFIFICNFHQKSQSVKEEILYLLEELLVQYNRLILSQSCKQIQPLLKNFYKEIVNHTLLQYMDSILLSTSKDFTNIYIQNKMFEKIQICQQEYAITATGGFQKQLHLTCIKILLELCLEENCLQFIVISISKCNSKYIGCIWQAIQLLYPGKINQNLIPAQVKQRIEKIKNGNIEQLLMSMDINKEEKMRVKEEPSWYRLYRNILREDSTKASNQMINEDKSHGLSAPVQVSHVTQRMQILIQKKPSIIIY